MITKNHTIELKDTSASEMARFRQIMLGIWRQQIEDDKNGDGMEKFIVSQYESTNEQKTSFKKTTKPKTIAKQINKRGFVIAENGIRLHATPSPYDASYLSKKGIFGKVYKVVSEVVVIHQDLTNKGWYKIKTADQKYGYIETHNIVLIPHNNYLDKYTRAFLYVKSDYNFETNIANVFYKNYKIETGNDRRTLAEAFYLLNTKSNHAHGIILKNEALKTGNSFELAIKGTHDPDFHKARLTYSQLQLSANRIVRIPNEQYIQLQRQIGTLSSRSEFMNTAIKTGDIIAEILAGVGGLIVGVIEGILRGIYDTLVGIIEYIESIIDTIRDLLSGKFLDKLKEMYQAIIKLANSSWSELKNILYSFLGSIGDSVKKVIDNWFSSSPYEKGRVIGLLLGTILLEVIIGIFTGGGATFAKLASKLGKLGKILMKIEKFTHEIKEKLLSKLPKKLFEKGDYIHDLDDSKNWMRSALLVQARATAEIMDVKGYSIGQLMTTLKLSGKLYPKLKIKWDSIHKRDNIYAITLTASPTKTVDSHFSSEGKKDEDKTSTFENDLKHNKGYYNGPKPKYENPGHHDLKSPNFRGGGSKTEIIPENAEALYKRAIPGLTNKESQQGIPKKWYSIDEKGKIHQFQVDNNGYTHWAGSENGSRGVTVDNATRKRLDEFYKDFIKKK
ncbi:hypothetical protein [Flavobacterium sp. PS2]|uniref:hypothetical protein n=1 Tax=Flavobacterium sp. PS2 TaxID=3384157 RepID=UPI00390CB45D